MAKRSIWRSAGALLISMGTAQAQTLSTGFDGLTTGGPTHWSGVFFDVTALHPDGVTITGWDIDASQFAGSRLDVRVWAKPGSFVGHHTNEAAWTLMGHITKPATGRGNPNHINIGNLHIRQNEIYGIRIGVQQSSVVFKSATQTQAHPIFANDDLRIDLSNGVAQFSIWSGGFTPRGWNGTVHYELGNAAHFGSCCLPDGSCKELNIRFCTGVGGVFMGVDTACASTTCHTGACCLADGSCIQTSRSACDSQSGVYRGDSSMCAGANCPQPGACCYRGACKRVLAERCVVLGGTFRGGGTHCPSTCSILWRPMGAGFEFPVGALTIFNGEPAAASTLGPIMRWDGGSWLMLGLASHGVSAASIFDGQLIVAGEMVSRWDPQSFVWRQLGGVLKGYTFSYPYYHEPPRPRAFAIYESELIMGGLFSRIEPFGAQSVARWDGATWRRLGHGLGFELTQPPSYAPVPFVAALAVYDGKLIAGGKFALSGTVPLSNIAWWDGEQWQSLGDGVDDEVYALASYRGELVVGGRFRHAGQVPVRSLAAWNGSVWRPLRGGFDRIGFGNVAPSVRALAVYQDELIAGGSFTHADGAPAANIARWDGAVWRPLGLGISPEGQVNVLAVRGDKLVVGGAFSKAGNEPMANIATWRGAAPAQCYPNCDGSTTPPYLDANDLTCFINQYTAASSLPYVFRRTHYANCDGSTAIPVLTIDDFVCFMTSFARGCP